MIEQPACTAAYSETYTYDSAGTLISKTVTPAGQVCQVNVYREPTFAYVLSGFVLISMALSFGYAALIGEGRW
jgi:hypothetical protein